MIHVTKTFLPPQEEYQAILKKAWATGWMTNRGVLVQELEQQLKKQLDVNYVLAMTNGTLPIQIAIKALALKGEIITTPFSYVATTSSIVWEGCKPVFVDIDPNYLTIDVSKIEAAITPKTSAILATHVFGNPCDVEAIAIVAQKHNLQVIYDAAHCFGVTYKEQSIFNFGNVSTCSFHATKIFHTGEGGAIFCNTKEILDTLFYHHNFGHQGKEAFQGLGINAKMSEMQAALGLAVLPHMPQIFENRKNIVALYTKKLNSEACKTMTLRKGTQWNYCYYPVIFKSEAVLLQVIAVLNEKSIFPRRYFHPSLDTLPYIDSAPCLVSRDIASRILCLPLYEDLPLEKVKDICKLINEAV